MSHDSTPDTLDHINKVQSRMGQIINGLSDRASVHDASKLESPEKEGYDALGESLKGLEYGSEEYQANLRKQKPTIQAHYEANSHHPEHYEDGVKGMSLLDVVEMFADWKAAGERTDKGDIRRSLEINRERFGIDDQLFSILKNSVEELGW